MILEDKIKQLAGDKDLPPGTLEFALWLLERAKMREEGGKLTENLPNNWKTVLMDYIGGNGEN